MGGFTRAITRSVGTVFKKKKSNQGIELAKSVDSKVGDTQKKAANTIKGPTELEVLADTKRRGRKATMLTSSKGIEADYTLSKKTLLG